MPHPLSAPVIMTLPDTIEVTNADQVRDRLSAAIASAAPLIIADLSATVFCDAAGADWLRMIGYHTAARNGRLRLVIPPGALMRRMVQLLGIDHLLAVYSSVADACEPLAGPRHPMLSRHPAGWAAAVDTCHSERQSPQG